MSRSCMFCGRSGVSKEHALPLWLGRVLPGGVPPKVVSLHVDVPPRAVNDFRSVPECSGFSQQVKAVCRDCNNGWMSRLEVATKPLLLALFQRGARQLTAQDQETLATWSIKTALMIQALRPHTRVVFPDQCKDLYEYRKPPLGSTVWLAHYDGPWALAAWPVTMRVSQTKIPFRPTIVQANACMTTLLFGNVLLRVWLLRDHVHSDETGKWSGPCWPTIWPTTDSLRWRADGSIHADQLNAFIYPPGPAREIDPWIALRFAERLAGNGPE